MIQVSMVKAAFDRQWKSSLSSPQTASWVLLALFPAVLIWLIQALRSFDPDAAEQTPWGLLLFFLIVEVECLLNLLLWATPVVQSELESKTWTYLSVRPYGRRASLFGKYLAATLRTILGAWAAIGFAVVLTPVSDKVTLALALAAAATLSSLAYGALFTAIGVLFPQRSMMIAVGYCLVMELMVASIPALINQLTARYHLLGAYFGWRESEQATNFGNSYSEIYGTPAPLFHTLSLTVYTLALLSISWYLVQRREYLTASED